MRKTMREALERCYRTAVSVAPGIRKPMRPVVYLTKRVLGLSPDGTPRYDAWLVGYPKTGNTWFQVMLRKAIVLHHGLSEDWLSRLINADPRELPDGVPAVGMTHNMPDLLTERCNDLRQNFTKFAARPVVLLAREPKDVLVSLFMQYTYREDPRLLYCEIEEMPDHEILGLDKYIRFYRQWEENWHVPDRVMLVRYEDMKKDTAAVMRRALPFLGLQGISEEHIRQVVEYGSFNNMRDMEKRNSLGLGTLAPSSRGGKNSFKVRRGKVAGYRDHFSPETVARIDRRLQQELPDRLGYPLQTD